MSKFIILYVSFSLILFSPPIALFAQNGAQLEYIVLTIGDTLYGKVSYIDEGGPGREFYKKIRLKNTDGKIKKYKRKGVSAFRVNNSTYKSFWLNQSSQKIVLVNPKYDIDPKDGDQYFLRVLSTGKLSHYELEWFDQGSSTLRSMALLKKVKDPFFIRADQGLLGLKRKVLQKYFFDCPKLKEAIHQKELNQVGQLLDFYNRNCAN